MSDSECSLCVAYTRRSTLEIASLIRFSVAHRPSKFKTSISRIPYESTLLAGLKKNGKINVSIERMRGVDRQRILYSHVARWTQEKRKNKYFYRANATNRPTENIATRFVSRLVTFGNF
jgi:hypothetical protein